MRDIIVIGASLGGVEALSALAGQLPADLPAAVLVVQHTSPDSPGLLPEILARVGRLPVATAADGMSLERGRILVAQPDRHLLVAADRVRVVFGPRENRSRPAIDALFRTAAVHGRSRVIGVVLTGLLNDGAAGLSAIHECGGVALVQDPADARYGEMPARALDAVPAARVVTLEEMGALLDRLARERAPIPPPLPDTIRIEVQLTERGMSEDWNQVPGRSTDFTCPDCGGALRRIDGEGPQRYRCRVGHAFNDAALVAAKDGAVEEALWVALQTLQERVQMLETMAREDTARGWTSSAATYETRSRETQLYADRLRGFIQQLGSG